METSPVGVPIILHLWNSWRLIGWRTASGYRVLCGNGTILDFKKESIIAWSAIGCGRGEDCEVIKL